MKYLMLFFSLVLIVFFSSTACKSKNKKEPPKDYLDVPAYLRGQLKYIEKEPFAFLKITQKDSVSAPDSQFVKQEEVRQLAESFLTNEMKKGNFEKNYTETVFADETLDMVTLTYNTDQPGLAVSRIDIYVNPEKERISQLYIIKSETGNNDSAITRQLLWRHNKSCTIITAVSKNGQPQKTITEKIIWDSRED